MRIFQKGFNYSQDGYGNRLVYHLQGCNMRCPWCSNPEGMRPEGVLMTEAEWLLDSVCPYGAVTQKKLDRTFCAKCEARECVSEHRTKGLHMSFEEVAVESLIAEAVANSPMYYDGGGVTFTGGEATIQFEELLRALEMLQAQGIHTAVETNGSHPRLAEAFPYIDQLIMDCKLCDSTRHKQATGIRNEMILENIRRAAKQHPCLHIRVPLIGGVNDSVLDREAFLAFFQTLRGEHVTFEVLAYHEFGRQKWEQCGLVYEMTDCAHVEDQVVRQFREDMKAAGLQYLNT